MLEQPAQEVERLVAELAVAIWVIKHIVTLCGYEGLVHMHSIASNPEDRLWHEGSMEIVLQGNSFYQVFEEEYSIGGVHGICVFYVNLMLACCDLVMNHLCIEPHHVCINHSLLPYVVALIMRHEVKVGSVVVWLAGDLSSLAHLEQEELELWASVVNTPHLFNP